MSELSKYTQKGDTWWLTDRTCNECGTEVASNGTVVKCYNCDNWELLE